MNHPVLKRTTGNIINLWFGEDTPIRQYKVAMNPELWAACRRVNSTFIPPSGALSINYYRRSDCLAFAKAVQQELYQVAIYT